ncbi:TPA: SbcC/MukB-like Walker B domain-containing protein [Pseudomonas aeruginosa]
MKRLESIKLVQFLLYEYQEFQLDEVVGLFGLNGSGKSSALDAVQIAMFGANKNAMAFNAQADSSGSKQSRTLRSYCLGQYGDEASECVRPNAATYITLVWRNLETGEPISIGVCLEASLDADDARVLGRYVANGLELAMADHLQTANGVTTALPWSSFRQRLLERSKATGDEPLFEDATSYVKQVLFALRGKAGLPSYDAFIRAFRFALRMRFDKPVDQIVRHDVLENRPTNIRKFKAIVDTFKRLNALVESVEQKITEGTKVTDSFHVVQKLMRHAASWKGLGAIAQEEDAQLRQEAAVEALELSQRNVHQLNAKSDQQQKQLDALKEEISHLTSLQQAHAAHKENAAAQIDLKTANEKLSKAATQLKAILGQLAGVLRNSAGDPRLLDCQESLHALEARIQTYAHALTESDSKALREILLELNSLGSQAGEMLEAAHLSLAAQNEEVSKELKVLQASLERAGSGRASLSHSTQKLINELVEHGLGPTPVCDLVRITDAQWQPAIEAYLAKNVEALLLPAEQEELAFDIYRELKGRRAIYGVKIVRSAQIRQHSTSQKGWVAELIEGTNQTAVAYLRGKLGNLKRADQSSEALSSERTLTRDGMLAGPNDFERLELSTPEHLKIGGGSQNQVEHLRAELSHQRARATELRLQLTSLNTLRVAVGSLSSESTAQLLLSQADFFRDALQQRERASQRVSGIENAEYLALCEKLAHRLGEVGDHEASAREARDAALKAGFELEKRQAACESANELLRQCSQRKQACRQDIDYDPDFVAAQWDKLLERHPLDAQGMAAACLKHSEECAKSASDKITRANAALWAYLSDHREVISEEVVKDWRTAKLWIDEHVAKLVNTELPEYKVQAADAYQASQETFRKDVAIALSTNLQFLRQTFERLNAALRNTPPFSNGERYQFIYKIRPDLKPLLEFIKSVADFGVDGGLFGEPGNVPPQFEELLREKTLSGNAAIKSPLDDYREFYEFDVRIERVEPDGITAKTIGHLSKRIGPGSGGEHRAPLYVIAGAGLWSAYRMDHGANDGARLILLDEAFDKMDASNIVATMKYLQELGLQVLMASPGENLGTLTAFLHRYFEIQKDPVRHTIQVEEFRVSEAMRQQFREDLWEFHPELLEQEIEAVRMRATLPASQPAPAEEAP